MRKKKAALSELLRSAEPDSSFLAFGSATFDVLARVGHWPQADEACDAKALYMGLGGPAAVASVGVSRLGYRSSYLGHVAADPYGAIVLDELIGNGVSVVEGCFGAADRCRVTLGLVDSKGERYLVYQRPSVVQLPSAVMSTGSSSDLLLVDDATEQSVALAKEFRKLGKQVVFDGGWSSPLVSELLEHVTHAVVSSEFVKAWRGAVSAEVAINEMREYDPELVVVTEGEAGAVIAPKGERVTRIEAIAADVVDSTGAGDAFHIGVVVGMLEGWAPIDAARLGVFLGARSCAHLGPLAGLPRRAELIDLLESVGM